MEVQALAQMRAAPKLAGDEGAGAGLRRAPHRDRAPRGAGTRPPGGPRGEPVARRGPARRRSAARASCSSPAPSPTRRASSPPTPSPTSTWSWRPTTCSPASPSGSATRRRSTSRAASARRRTRWRSGSTGSGTATVDASLEGKDPAEALDDYLADAHALEAQGDRSCSSARRASSAGVADNHLAESQRHTELIERRLADRDESPSRLKDAALRLGAINWSGFFGAQPDTPAKLAMFIYAFEHLEIGALRAAHAGRAARRGRRDRAGGRRRSCPTSAAGGREALRRFDARSTRHWTRR